MLSTIRSGTLYGIEAVPIQVEVNTGESGELRLIMVGLPDASVRESRDRVFSALANTGFHLPNTRTTVNLAPGDIRKEGPFYDLPIALGLIEATSQVSLPLMKDFLIVGELALSGQLRPIKGALSFVLLARKLKLKILLPILSAEEAALIEDVEVYGVDSLREVVEFLSGEKALKRLQPKEFFSAFGNSRKFEGDFSEIKGQKALKRAVEVAVAGGHNLIMIGPPGVGKSMVAKRIPSIMPEPNFEEFLEIMNIQSVAGITIETPSKVFERPFRSPHHTISDVGLLGGGSIPTPGEISLAHHGVLFLDELPEFKRSTLEVLRQPLEDGKVMISRSSAKLTFPCAFMLVAAMNPCPCGYLGSSRKQCRCTVPQIQRYRSRISGPLLDRIDLHIDVGHMSIEQMQKLEEGESSATVAKRVKDARAVQEQRFKGHFSACNARMSDKALKTYCQIGTKESDLLERAIKQLSLSARAYTKILKVARTIADLDHQETIGEKAIFEAIQYRFLDRNLL